MSKALHAAVLAHKQILLILPETAEIIALQIPEHAWLFRVFARNGWKPFGDDSRKIALEITNQQEERDAR